MGKVLNRVINYIGDGYELKADHRHSETIVEELGVSGSGGITTAGCQNEGVETPSRSDLPRGLENITRIGSLKT